MATSEDTGATQTFSGSGVVQSEPTQQCWEFQPSDGSPLMTFQNPALGPSVGDTVTVKAHVKGTRMCSNLDWIWDSMT
jgi:hypothetical protein